MNTPKAPNLPKINPKPVADTPHPLDRPDERKEGGPDFGKAEKQHENHAKAEKDGRTDDPPAVP